MNLYRKKSLKILKESMSTKLVNFVLWITYVALPAKDEQSINEKSISRSMVV